MKYLFAGLMLFLTPVLHAQEFAHGSIQKVDITLELHKDRSATVTEQYTFIAGGTIGHGLYRLLPIKYYSGANHQYKTPIKILSIKRDEVDSDYHTQTHFEVNRQDVYSRYSDKNAILNKVIYIGEKDVLLNPGSIHTTTIKYHIEHVVKNTDSTEAFGWNVTGYQWPMMRNNVTVTVRLPETFEPENISFFSSTLNVPSLPSLGDSKKTDGSVISHKEDSWHYNPKLNTITYAHNRMLFPAEDITVFVHFPKKTFTPALSGLRAWWTHYNLPFIMIIGLLLSTLIWFLFWQKYGRDPKIKRIKVLYGAPKALTPAECRYFRYRTVDKRSSIAMLVDAAIKGFIKIEKPEDSEHFILKRNDKNNDMPADMASCLKPLIGLEKIKVKSTASVAKKFDTFVKSLEKIIHHKYPVQFSANSELFFLGLIPLLISSIFCFFIEDHFNLTILILSFIIGVFVNKILFAFMEKRQNWVNYFQVIFALAAIAFTIIKYPDILYISYINIAVFMSAGFSGGLWRYLMRNKKLEGSIKEEEIKAFEHYLRSTEERLMDFVNKPDEAPALFERNLPYAIALDLELRWVKTFQGAIAQHAEIGNYHMGWATGAITYHTLSHDLVDDIHSSSSYTPPSSSGSSFSGGGFSGGGFSGGGSGFGGGGGGGW